MIHYVEGDATYPKGGDLKIIAHICNDSGYWGRGFVMAISKRWKDPQQEYRAWYSFSSSYSSKLLPLGEVQFVKVEPNIVVANMIAQHNIWHTNGRPPIRYDAVRRALTTVSEYAKTNCATIHMPYIGAGLAGGDWADIEAIISDVLKSNEVFIYNFRG